MVTIPTESEAPSVNPKCGCFSFAFPRLFAFSLALRFSWRLAICISWRLPFPGDSHVLAVPAWRFPTCPGGPWFGRTSTEAMTLLSKLFKSRFLVAFGAPAPSSYKGHARAKSCPHATIRGQSKARASEQSTGDQLSGGNRNEGEQQRRVVTDPIDLDVA